jgi:hypothetical protein
MVLVQLLVAGSSLYRFQKSRGEIGAAGSRQRFRDTHQFTRRKSLADLAQFPHRRASVERVSANSPPRTVAQSGSGLRARLA